MGYVWAMYGLCMGYVWAETVCHYVSCRHAARLRQIGTEILRGGGGGRAD